MRRADVRSTAASIKSSAFYGRIVSVSQNLARLAAFAMSNYFKFLLIWRNWWLIIKEHIYSMRMFTNYPTDSNDNLSTNGRIDMSRTYSTRKPAATRRRGTLAHPAWRMYVGDARKDIICHALPEGRGSPACAGQVEKARLLSQAGARGSAFPLKEQLR